MEEEDERRMQSIVRSDEFMRVQKFPGTAIKAAAKRLAVARAQLGKLKVREKDAQDYLPLDGHEIRKRCRNLRKEFLSPASRAAKAIEGFLQHTPGAAQALRVPHLTDSAALHVEAGDRFGKFLKHHRTSFLKEAGLGRNFLSKLRAATDELLQQSQLVHKTRHERTELLREIKLWLSRGRAQIDLLKSVLEPFLIERKLEGAWAAASRVGRRKGRRRDTAEQRAEKRVQNAARKAERLEQQRLRRELRKQARRAKRLQNAEAKKARQSKRESRATQSPPAPPPPQPPMSKAMFLERLAEQDAEIDR